MESSMADGLRRKLVCDRAQITHSSYVSPCALHTVSQTDRYDRPYGFTASLEMLIHRYHTCERIYCVLHRTRLHFGRPLDHCSISPTVPGSCGKDPLSHTLTWRWFRRPSWKGVKNHLFRTDAHQ